MTEGPPPRTPAELLAALAPVEEGRLAAMRSAAGERPIAYPVGTGEAEEVALAAGIKPLVRQFLSAADAEGARARFEAHGLHVAEARPSYFESSGRVLYVGRDPARVQAALHADSTTDMEERLGLLLGYPPCCVARYLDLRPPRRNADLLRLALASTRGRLAPRLNVCDLQTFHFVSWMPCAFDCARSLAYANRVAWQIAFRHGQALQDPAAPRTVCPPRCAHQRFIARIDRALGAHRLVLFEDAQLSLRGRPEGRRIVVEEVWPAARDRRPDAPSDGDRPEAREVVARVCSAIATGARVELADDALFVDGHCLARSSDLLLLPFGE